MAALDIVVVEHLSIRYPDGRMAVSDFSCHIGIKERVALLGANGAGKSSLLLALVGLSPVTTGRIVIASMEVTPNTLKTVRQKTGMLFQNPDDQLFCISVEEDVAFGPRNLGWPDDVIKARTTAAMEQTGILHLARQPPYKLSGGEKRKVSLACVLAMEPEILLFDEPTAFLDPRSQRELAIMINSLPQSCLIATHDLSFAQRVCSRGIILENGNLVHEGSMPDLLADEDMLFRYGLV